MNKKKFILCFILLLIPSGLSAEDKVITDKISTADSPPDFTIKGIYWFHWNRMKGFPLDETGFEDGVNQYADHRLRVKPLVNVTRNLIIRGNFDFLGGQVFGDTTDTGKDVVLLPRNKTCFYCQVTPRELYLEWMTPYGMLRIGQQASSWGLGLVANDGEDRDDIFVDPRFGDLVERVLFVTRPIELFSKSDLARHLYLVFGGDLVYRDEYASLIKGDIAFQGLLALFYEKDKDFMGIYTAYRNQKYEDGDKLWAIVIDAYGRYAFRVSNRITLGVEGEGATILGRTNVASFMRAKDGLDLRSFGGVLRMKGIFPFVASNIEVGFAQGDPDIQDSVGRTFSFDPDYAVGMIIFPELLARMSARAADRAADPRLVARPTKGYELSATNGATTNTVYLYPSISIRPIERIDIRLAFLWARAVAEIASPLNTAQNGGYPISYRGGKGKELGIEMDGSLSFLQPLYKQLALKVGFQFGMAKPGDAFSDGQGKGLGYLWKVRGLLDILW